MTIYLVQDMDKERALIFENVLGDLEIRLGKGVRGEVRGSLKGLYIKEIRDRKTRLQSGDGRDADSRSTGPLTLGTKLAKAVDGRA